MSALEDYVRSQRKIKDRNDPMRDSVMSQSSTDPLAYSPEQDALEGSNPEDWIPNPKSLATLLAKAGTKLGGLGALGMVKGYPDINKLRKDMLSKLEPIENIEGSIFKPFKENKGLPVSGLRSKLYNPDTGVYPVYHGATELHNSPLIPYSKAADDLTWLVDSRKDPRDLAYATLDPGIASMYAYGDHSGGARGDNPLPNIRAYIGRDLPVLSRKDFYPDIGSMTNELSRAEIAKISDLLNIPYHRMYPLEIHMPRLIRELETRNEAIRPDFPELADRILSAKVDKVGNLPANYIYYMEDLSGFDRYGNPKHAFMPQVMLTDPKKAIDLEHLIPLKGKFARGGLVQMKQSLVR